MLAGSTRSTACSTFQSTSSGHRGGIRQANERAISAYRFQSTSSGHRGGIGPYGVHAVFTQVVSIHLLGSPRRNHSPSGLMRNPRGFNPPPRVTEEESPV